MRKILLLCSAFREYLDENIFFLNIWKIGSSLLQRQSIGKMEELKLIITVLSKEVELSFLFGLDQLIFCFCSTVIFS